MSYESPIKLITDVSYKIIEDQEQNIYKAVCSYGIDISKDELFKLLYDDRKQYDKGYSDGYIEAQGDIVRCKDCRWYKESKHSELRPVRFCYRLRNLDGTHVGYNWDDNDFCSYGERREDDNE